MASVGKFASKNLPQTRKNFSISSKAQFVRLWLVQEYLVRLSQVIEEKCLILKA